ncbi:MAG: hypothetical protein RIQ53_3028 [Pseudomonadota bacterium]
MLQHTGGRMPRDRVIGRRAAGWMAAAAMLAASGAAQADMSVVLGGLGGTSGYGTQVMTPNDDQSSSRLDLPFTLNFYDSVFSTFFVNNNGNITFNGAVGTFTPTAFPIASQPMIAPYWGDVDTRCNTCGAVYVATPNADTVVVTWDRVGYFAGHADRTNTFQLVLRDRDDTNAAGQVGANFDIEFRYGQLTWTTGDASGGSGGTGGVPAQAGLDAGNRTDFFTLPGSRTASVVALADTSNVSAATPGLWSFSVRNGETPGATSDNPLMPVVNDGSWSFNFNIGPNTNGGIGVNGRPIFIDPVIAVGYDYAVSSGPNFQSVLLPVGIGDGLYDLWLWDSALAAWVDSGTDLSGGVSHDFGAAGVDRFRIAGIETAAGLNPNDTNAFVTGLTFVSGGSVQMSMTPITVDTGTGGGGTNPVPLPGSLPLAALGLAALWARQRRQRAH